MPIGRRRGSSGTRRIGFWQRLRDEHGFAGGYPTLRTMASRSSPWTFSKFFTKREVHSEKVIEIVFKDGVPIRNGDQFGLGRIVPK